MRDVPIAFEAMNTHLKILTSVPQDNERVAPVDDTETVSTRREIALAVRVGEVTDITPPGPGKKSGSCKVGGRKVWYFYNAYQSDEPSLVRQFLEDAQANGVRVEVTGDEFTGTGPTGTPYTSFTAKDVRAASQTPQNGSQEPQTASYGQGQAGAPAPTSEGKRYVGREPGEADYWLAMRWAYSLATDLLRGEAAVPSIDEISKLAGQLFSRSRYEALVAKEEAEASE